MSRSVSLLPLLFSLLVGFSGAGYVQQPPLLSYDYIVVGAGVAGCVVAARLSEDKSVNVLLVEAGGKTQSSVGGTDWVGRSVTRSDVPYLTYTAFEYYDDYFWDFSVNVGKGVGGGGIVNGMRWVRALDFDFQKWNVTGWDYASMLPYFKRTETNTGAATQNSPYHGYSGPVEVSDPVYASEESTYFVQSALASGYSFLKDFNGDPSSRIGAGYHQYNIRKGIRDSSANAYLAPALSRSNLHVLVNSQVTEIVFNGQTATGIEYVVGGDLSKIMKANLTREVVLTAGTINTPKLLMLSGIGNRNDLKRFPDIPMVADLPGVGLHFQDHALIVFAWDVTNEPNPSITSLGYWQGQYDLSKTGILASIDRSGLFMNSGQHPSVPKNIPDIQVEVQDDATYIVYIVQPESANGTVKLQSSNPLTPPLIVDPIVPANIQENDVLSLIWTVKQLQTILSRPPMANIVGKRNTPPPDLVTDQQLHSYIKQNVQSGNHLVGTCRMGTQAVTKDAVVNEQLQVYGVKGVRVADASIIPTITNGNQQANLMAIAERAVDYIRKASLL